VVSAALIFLLAVGPALTGQTNPLTRPPTAGSAASTPVTVVQFSPPIEITIRTKRRIVLRCLMLSFDAETVQIRTRRGKVIPFETARILTLRTRDGMFSWKPASETFETARKNAELFQSGLPTAGRLKPKRLQPRPGNPLIPKPRPQPPTIPKVVRPARSMTRTPQAPTTTPDGTDGSMQTPGAQNIPDEQGKVCASCQRAVSNPLSTGNFCPYCGVRWSEQGGHVAVVEGGDAHTTSVRLPPGTTEVGPMSWHQVGQKYWWVGLVVLVGWAVRLLRS